MHDIQLLLLLKVSLRLW